MLGEVVAAVPDGSATVVVHGEAGMGKSSLLHWTAELAGSRGAQVLWATGLQFERELAFSGLIAVLRPVMVHRDALNATQRGALEVAMGLAAGDAALLVTYGATLALLSAASDQTPLLVVVDDAHWLDQASLSALLFASHRAGPDRIGFVFAQRADEWCLLDDTRFDRIELTGLGRDVAIEVLVTEGATEAVAERCWQLAGGNPLAMLEGVRGLSARQRAGRDPLPPALPAADRLLGAFQVRLRQLPDATVRALGLAALDPSGRATVIAHALDHAGLGLSDLGPAEDARLVAVADDNLSWYHPLFRSAVYSSTDNQWRRQAHRALAHAAQDAGNEDSALWHLSEAIVGPDDRVAAQLDALGVAARRRGALAAAVEAHARSANLWTKAADAHRQILAAAEARWASGDLIGAIELLGARIDSVADAAVRAQMAMVLGQAEMWTVSAPAGIERFERNASAMADDHPDVAAYLLLHATTARMMTLDAAGAVRTADRAQALAERTNDGAVFFATSAMQTLAHVLGATDASAADRLEPMTQLILAALETGTEGIDDLAQLCALGLVVIERWQEAIDLLQRLIRASDLSGMAARGAFARLLLAEVLWRAGRWAESLAELSQSISLQEAVRPGHVVPGTLALMARLEAGFGQTDSCKAHVAQVLDTPPQIELFTAIALSANGLLELGLGRHAEAAAAFDQILDSFSRAGEPGLLWWQGDAIETYAACGRIDDARQVLGELEVQANATTRAWALAAVERGKGLLERESPWEDHLNLALEGFRSLGAPFEEARTLLVRGQRRIASGDHEPGARDIAAARTIFDRLGARSWSERASATTGEASGPDAALTSRLTTAELRVAMAVGHGASNREAADQLYISPKTVDYHLQSIYRKLGLRSRNQLMTIVLVDTQR